MASNVIFLVRDKRVPKKLFLFTYVILTVDGNNKLSDFKEKICTAKE